MRPVDAGDAGWVRETLDALEQRRGIGTALLASLVEAARGRHVGT